MPEEAVARFDDREEIVKEHLLSLMAADAKLFEDQKKYQFGFEEHNEFGSGSTTFEILVEEVPSKPERDRSEIEQVTSHYWDV